MDEAALRAAVAAIAPATSWSARASHAVHEVAAALQVRRAHIAARLAAGRTPGAEMVAVGLPRINEWLYDDSSSWRQLRSAHPAAGTAQLRRSLPLTRRLLEEGLEMVSLFDHAGTDPEARQLLAAERLGTYVFGLAPVQMKIVNERYALLQGPLVDDEPSLAKVWDPACLEAAWQYWHTAVAHLVPFEPAPSDAPALTPRQRQIVAMLASDLNDEAVASSLGVSVRTVRSDIAAVLDALGVRSRFAAAVRLRG